MCTAAAVVAKTSIVRECRHLNLPVQSRGNVTRSAQIGTHSLASGSLKVFTRYKR